MDDRTVQQRVLDVLTAQTGVENISLESTFLGDLKFDSLDVVETSVRLEDEFDHDFVEDDSIGSFTTVGQLVTYVEGRING